MHAARFAANVHAGKFLFLFLFLLLTPPGMIDILARAQNYEGGRISYPPSCGSVCPFLNKYCRRY
jgi:hypothetical protein